jgi:hypothetical protein
MLVREPLLVQRFPNGQAVVGAFVVDVNAAMRAPDINSPTCRRLHTANGFTGAL